MVFAKGDVAVLREEADEVAKMFRDVVLALPVMCHGFAPA